MQQRKPLVFSSPVSRRYGKAVHSKFWNRLRERIDNEQADAGRIRVWVQDTEVRLLQQQRQQFNRLQSDSPSWLISEICEPQARVFTGGYGLTRYRLLELHNAPSEDSDLMGSLYFGDLYRIVEVSESLRWLKVESIANGHNGWMRREHHFGISNGEYKILSGKKSLALGFLINALSKTNYGAVH